MSVNAHPQSGTRRHHRGHCRLRLRALRACCARSAPSGADGMITTTAVNSLGAVPGDRVGAVIVRRVRDSAIAAPLVLGPERRTELTAAATADLGKPEKARHHLLVAREPSGGHRSHFGLKARCSNVTVHNAYDQIDQACTELNAVSKETRYEGLKTSCRRWHGDMTDIADQR